MTTSGSRLSADFYPGFYAHRIRELTEEAETVREQRIADGEALALVEQDHEKALEAIPEIVLGEIESHIEAGKEELSLARTELQTNHDHWINLEDGDEKTAIGYELAEEIQRLDDLNIAIAGGETFVAEAREVLHGPVTEVTPTTPSTADNDPAATKPTVGSAIKNRWKRIPVLAKIIGGVVILLTGAGLGNWLLRGTQPDSTIDPPCGLEEGLPADVADGYMDNFPDDPERARDLIRGDLDEFGQGCEPKVISAARAEAERTVQDRITDRRGDGSGGAAGGASPSSTTIEDEAHREDAPTTTVGQETEPEPDIVVNLECVEDSIDQRIYQFPNGRPTGLQGREVPPFVSSTAELCDVAPGEVIEIELDGVLYRTLGR